jgi:hypothetical protein
MVVGRSNAIRSKGVVVAADRGPADTGHLLQVLGPCKLAGNT